MIQFNIQLFAGNPTGMSGDWELKDGYFIQKNAAGKETKRMKAINVTLKSDGYVTNNAAKVGRVAHANTMILTYLNTGRIATKADLNIPTKRENRYNNAVTDFYKFLKNNNIPYVYTPVRGETTWKAEGHHFFESDSEGNTVNIISLDKETMPSGDDLKHLVNFLNEGTQLPTSISADALSDFNSALTSAGINKENFIELRRAQAAAASGEGEADSGDGTNPYVQAYQGGRTDITEDAFNKYYADVMRPQLEGTFGKQVLDNNYSLFTKEAQNAAMLAESSLQAQALAQAQTTKQVVDSLRQERFAQLRAGMNESQLADRELQMLLGTTQQLTAQNQQARQDALAASLGQSTAYEQAFNQYVEQATALGQNATANYASAVADPIDQAYMLKLLTERLGKQQAEELYGMITGKQTN